MVLYESLSDLASDEEFLVGTTAYDSVLKRFQTRLFVTNRRFIAGKKVLYSTELQSVPLSAITNVETDVTLNVTTLTVQAAGDVEESYVLRGDETREFVRVLRERVAAVRGGGSTEQRDPAIDALREQYARGGLSETEYEERLAVLRD